MSDDDTAGKPSGTRRLLSAGAIMAAGTMASRILGFVRVMLVAFVLGNGTRRADIFSLALTVPTSLYILFAGGALNTVLVPQIVRAVQHDEDGGEAYTNRIMTAFLLIVAGVAALVTAAAPVVVGIYTSAQWKVPALAEHYHSLVMLSYLCLPQVFFFGAFFLIGQVLNARDRFGPMMWAPIANNVVQVLVIVVYLLVWGNGGDQGAPFSRGQVLMLGIGSTTGIIAQTLILLPFLRATGFRYRPRFDFKGTGLGKTFHLAKWTLGFVAVNQLALVVVNKLATSATATGHGAGLTVYNNAYLLWILPHSLITVSLATAMLPSASRMAAEGDLRGVSDEVVRTIKLAVTFLLPTAVGFIVLAIPLARVAFGHGRGAGDAQFVAWTLMAFAVGLVPFTMQYICLRAFYALENTRTTFWLQVLIATLNAGFAVAFVVPLNRPAWVAAGLAAAYSLAYIIGVYASLRLLKRSLPELALRPLTRHLGRLLVAVLPGALLALAALWAFGRLGSGMVFTLLGLVLGGALAITTFLIVARALRIEEVANIVAIIRRRQAPAAVDVRDAHVEDDPGAGTGSLETSTPSAYESLSASAMEESPSVPSSHMTFPVPDDGHERTVEITEQDGPVAQVRVGQVLGDRYRLEELLVQRGTTLTWRAFDTVLSRSVLMHILTPHEQRAEEILDAARRAAVATDSRFLRVLDAVESEDDEVGAYVVCEYAPGQSLENLLALGPLSALEAAWVVRELSDALTGMHTQSLYHRMLNPDTVIVTATGNVKIVGFLIEAALHPDMADAGPNPESDDVRALGKLLYATLVSRWPGGDRYGMASAPTDSSSHVLTPRQVKHGVSPSLDRITARILGDPATVRDSPLTTVADVCAELSKVLGTADASHDLERRMRFPVRPIVTGASAPTASSAPSATPPVAERPVDSDDDLDDTAPFTPVPPPSPRATTQPAATSASRAPVSVGGAGHTPPPHKPRRWLAVLIGLVLLTLVGSLIAMGIRGARQQNSQQGVPSTSATSAAAPVAHEIVAGTSFDPETDGGSGDERPNDVRNAFDGNPQTRWTTMRYIGNAKLGGQKPGVGIVLDLGSAQRVSQVTLTLSGSGTSAQVRVPEEDPAGAAQAPTQTVKDWKVVARGSKLSGERTLILKQPVTSRYILIYLTSLPAEGGGYVGGINEVEVLG